MDGKRSKLLPLGSLAVTLALFGSLTTPDVALAAMRSADGTSGASDCEAAAQTAIDERWSEGSTTPPVYSYFDYACAPGTVTVTLRGPADNEVERFESTLVNTDSSSLPTANRAVACSVTGEPQRQITSRFGSEIKFCIIYGQRDHPQNGSWTRSLDVLETIGLQTSYHPVSLRITPSDGSGYMWDLEGYTRFYQQNGIFSPTIEAQEKWESYFNQGQARENTGVERPSVTSSTTNSIWIESMYLVDHGKGFSSDVAMYAASQRFRCEARTQCEFPNSEEAPI